MSSPGRIARRAIEHALLVTNRDAEPSYLRIFVNGEEGWLEGISECVAPCFSVQFPSLKNSHLFMAALPTALGGVGFHDPRYMVFALGHSVEIAFPQQSYLLHFRGWELED